MSLNKYAGRYNVASIKQLGALFGASTNGRIAAELLRSGALHDQEEDRNSHGEIDRVRGMQIWDFVVGLERALEGA